MLTATTVSDPDHERYGQHLTQHDIKKLVQPHEDTVAQVLEWLADNEISSDDLTYSPGNDWIHVTLPVEEVESLLDTKYSVYQHEDGSSMVRTPEWKLPFHLHEHIDTIQPTNSFFRNAPKAKAIKTNKVANLKGKVTLDREYFAEPTVSDVCQDDAVTITCLRTYYGTIDYVAQANDTNIMGLADYLEESNNRSDTYLLLSQYRPEAAEAAYTFKFDVINNGTTQQVYPEWYIDEDEPDVEADLDSETMLGIGWPTPLIAYTVGGSPPYIADEVTTSDTNEPYLDWLAYLLATSDDDLAKVISTSYDDDEQTVPYTYAKRVCEEMAQLGARGVSAFFAAGDGGVGDSGYCVSNNGSEAKTFLPEFPSSCPYVTSVGATMNFSPEIVAYEADEDYASGGGFSSYFARPSYQDSVVSAYVESLDGEFDGYYNASGRGYPDIAAQGYNFVIVWDGEDVLVSGTSASTPTVASIFALVNDALIANGKSTMGFLNPWLYKYGSTSSAFNDITSGSAVGCSEIGNGEGFPAAEGWDAVTGWGTPKFEGILSLLGVSSESSFEKSGAWGGKVTY